MNAVAIAFMIVCTLGAVLIPHGRLPRRASTETETEIETGAEAATEPALALADG
jgi:hypothetical protein